MYRLCAVHPRVPGRRHLRCGQRTGEVAELYPVQRRPGAGNTGDFRGPAAPEVSLHDTSNARSTTDVCVR